jgi:hypothetical protein
LGLEESEAKVPNMAATFQFAEKFIKSSTQWLEAAWLRLVPLAPPQPCGEEKALRVEKN